MPLLASCAPSSLHYCAAAVTQHSRRKLFALLFLLLFLQSNYAQNTLDKLGLGGTTHATVAYSLRQLSSAYAGKAIQVRRDNDNATQDIGFTAGGNLDTASLKTFVGANNGFVTTWYDQSGNAANVSQAGTVYQPVIVQAGVIARQNGLPFIAFYGTPNTTNYNSLNLAAPVTTVGHVAAVHRFASGGEGFILSSTTAYYWHANFPGNLFDNSNASASVIGGAGWVNGNAASANSMPYPTVLTIDELEPATPGTGTAWDNIGSDRNQFHHISNGGGYSELVVFPGTLSTADRQALEGSQKVYYAVYALPVTWLGFTGQAQAAGISLNWQTATEQNTRSYTIQRSGNGNTWQNIGLLAAAGNSSNSNSYSYSDANPLTGLNYYRLLQTDLDDKDNYSTIITVRFAHTKAAFTLAANPITGTVAQVQINQAMTLSLYSANGKLLWTRQFDAGTQLIDLGNYAKGIYFLEGGATTQKLLYGN